MFIKLSTPLVVAVLLQSSCSETVDVYQCDLVPSTGFNDLCGAPVFPLWDPMDPRLPPGVNSVAFAAMQNTVGDDPIPLTPAICDANPDSLLATWANPFVYASGNFPFPDKRLLNIPYNRVPVTVGLDGLRAFALDHDDPGVTQPVPPTRSIPNEADTIASWTGVGGRATIKCFHDGSAHVKIRGDGYAPNSVLTVWIVWQTTLTSGLAPITSQALGGTPNTVVPDSGGKFTFERELSFCPFEEQNGSRPLSISIAKHIDGGNTYGGVPETPGVTYTFVDPADGSKFTSQGIGPGMMTVDQGVIPLLIAPDECSGNGN